MLGPIAPSLEASSFPEQEVDDDGQCRPAPANQTPECKTPAALIHSLIRAGASTQSSRNGNAQRASQKRIVPLGSRCRGTWILPTSSGIHRRRRPGPASSLELLVPLVKHTRASASLSGGVSSLRVGGKPIFAPLI